MKGVAQIPYIVHEARMYKAEKREIKLKILLAISNCLWLTGVVLSFVLR